MTALVIEPEYLEIVGEILNRDLPAGCRTYVFGSRATGVRVRATSDLDLAIDGPEPLSISTLGRLRDSFDEARIPWKVDIVDMNGLSDSFRRIVDRDKVPLQPL